MARAELDTWTRKLWWRGERLRNDRRGAPKGADAVVMIEDTKKVEDTKKIEVGATF